MSDSLLAGVSVSEDEVSRERHRLGGGELQLHW